MVPFLVTVYDEDNSAPTFPVGVNRQCLGGVHAEGATQPCGQPFARSFVLCLRRRRLSEGEENGQCF
ncbi:hypothetical protein P7K49_023437 [Saguinus oedipus]|uniref:Uncharacterized protein n=1 Tax=Saguinus oedipus TaxID=9490 RepID=A0ABQ9UMB6_SAGOE|nr:hypothetical protein P7K49_023437 [Saguinus oedipus]